MMKFSKLLGLAVLSALAVMAFAGASTASAKVCSTAGTGDDCGAGHGKTVQGELHAVLTNTTGTAEQHVVLTSGFIQVTCSQSTIQGTIDGRNTKGTITTLTFGGCTSPLGACTANSSATHAVPWAGKVSTLSTTEAKLEVTAPTGTFTCGGVTCRYDAAVAGAAAGELTVYGGDNKNALVEATVNLTKEEVSGAFCSNTAVWHGVYSVTTPSDLMFT